jgi:hypothetical protein
MSGARQEFRVVIEHELGPTESRVMRDERPIRTEEAARDLARYWSEPHTHAKGWVETRTVTDWQELSVADRERRGGGLEAEYGEGER